MKLSGNCRVCKLKAVVNTGTGSIETIAESTV